MSSKNALEHLLVRFLLTLFSDWSFSVCLASLVVEEVAHKVGCPGSKLTTVLHFFQSRLGIELR